MKVKRYPGISTGVFQVSRVGKSLLNVKPEMNRVIGMLRPNRQEKGQRHVMNQELKSPMNKNVHPKLHIKYLLCAILQVPQQNSSEEDIPGSYPKGA